MGRRYSLDPAVVLTAVMAITVTYFDSLRVVEGWIGINWGRQSSHRLIPSIVVDLLLQNNIKNLKLYSPSDNVLKAFAGSDITIHLTLPNESLGIMKFQGFPEYFLQNRIRKYQNQNVKIRYLYVGNQPLSTFNNPTIYPEAVDALRYIQDALFSNGYKNVTATTPQFMDVLNLDDQKPSKADFRADLKDKMLEYVRLLNRTGAPFVMDMSPMHIVSKYGWHEEFSFIDNTSNFTIEDDNGLIYRNAFEFVYDSFITAMEKAGVGHLKLMVGQIGWPTDGFPRANASNAERFYKGLLRYVTSTKGTQLRPGISIDTIIYSLADENMSKLTAGGFMRHWGIYRSDGQPKYKIDLSGQGRDIYPTTAKGVVLMPKRWCVFNGNTKNMTKVKMEMDFACKYADCTAMLPGGSCSNLSFEQNASYAFNRYFQTNAQSNENGHTCTFNGLGMMVLDDPSIGACRFQVEILAAEMVDSDGVKGGESGERFYGFSRLAMILSLILIFCLN